LYPSPQKEGAGGKLPPKPTPKPCRFFDSTSILLLLDNKLSQKFNFGTPVGNYGFRFVSTPGCTFFYMANNCSIYVIMTNIEDLGIQHIYGQM
jgi:hypothetical protein